MARLRRLAHQAALADLSRLRYHRGRFLGRRPRQSPQLGSEPYQPLSAEVDAAAKRTAVRAVEKLPQISEVTYKQSSGYLPLLASILVEADVATGRGTPYDVQISQSGGRWSTR